MHMINNFDITKFSNYRSIQSQYTDSYIKNQCSVVVEEDDDSVVVACSIRTEKKIRNRKS